MGIGEAVYPAVTNFPQQSGSALMLVDNRELEDV